MSCVSLRHLSECFSSLCPCLRLSKWTKLKVEDTEISIDIRQKLDIRECQRKKYSFKKLSAEEKLAKQLGFALIDRQGISKVETTPFIVPVPRLISKQKSSDQFAVAQHIGSRSTQEDGYMLNKTIEFTWHGQKKEGALFGVFDGHRDGGMMSKHLNEFFKSTLEGLLQRAEKDSNELNDEVITDIFTEAFHLLAESYEGCSGSTAVCLFTIDDRIYFPNVGDSRAILVGAQKCYQLTEDATLENKRFRTWHVKKGHEFYRDSGLRLEFCGLNMGRDLGRDHRVCHRNKITRIFVGSGKDDLGNGVIYVRKGDFIVLGSDGLFDTGTNLEVANEVRKLHRAGASLEQIAQGLVQTAGSYKESDNVTAFIFAV